MKESLKQRIEWLVEDYRRQINLNNIKIQELATSKNYEKAAKLTSANKIYAEIIADIYSALNR